MWRSQVVTVCAAFALVGLTWTGDVDVIKPQSVSAQGVSHLEVMPEYVENLSNHPRLLLDTKIETPAQNNNAQSLPERKRGDTIQFQLFVPGAAGTQIQGYTVELALKGKTFGSYVDVGDVSGTDFSGSTLLRRVSAAGNPTLSMLSTSAVAIPASGYLGHVDLKVSRELTSLDALEVASAEIASAGVVQNLDVSQALLTFKQAPACPGDFNGDGMVNLADFLAFAGGFGTRSGDAKYDSRADMDGNGAIDLSDFLAFAEVFGTTCEIAPPVTIPDANLRAVIEDSLGKASGAPITRAEMATLTRLDARNSGVRDLTGLDQATNLTWLHLGDVLRSGVGWVNTNRISDFTPLSGLTGLRRLYLSGNSMTDLSALTGLSNLTRLRLDRNSVSDVSALFSLSNLRYLSLDDNQLSGSIPVELVRLSNLQWLLLNENRLSGPIPAELGRLSNLHWLLLGENQLSGAIPVELGSLSNLERLWLQGNELSGGIPAALGKVSNLKWLYLSNNELTGEVPAALGNLSNLESLTLSGNDGLSGPLPGSFTRLDSLSRLVLYGTALCAPTDAAFQTWLQGIRYKLGVVNCPTGGGGSVAGTVPRWWRCTMRPMGELALQHQLVERWTPGRMVRCDHRRRRSGDGVTALRRGEKHRRLRRDGKLRPESRQWFVR